MLSSRFGELISIRCRSRRKASRSVGRVRLDRIHGGAVMARRLRSTGVLAPLLLALLAVGCGQRLDVGSDVLWSARFETNDFSEWSSVPGGAATAFPAPPNTIVVASEHAHHGTYAAKLTIDAGPGGAQENAGFRLAGGLPVAAYYSAWYYVPETVTVGGFWTVFKFRMRTVADDPTSDTELYDLDIDTAPGGEMTLQLYDHRAGNIPLDVQGVVLPVGAWFQLEAYYRNAPDTTGRVTYWLDGQQIVDVAGHPMSPNAWVEWNAVNVGVNLTPAVVNLFIDDCAVSLTRVGPTGVLAE